MTNMMLLDCTLCEGCPSPALYIRCNALAADFGLRSRGSKTVPGCKPKRSSCSAHSAKARTTKTGPDKHARDNLPELLVTGHARKVH